MATFNKFQPFVLALGLGQHDFSSDALKVALTNTLPVNTDDDISDITQIANGNGYTTGGNAATLGSWAQASGTAKLILTDVTFTATGAMGAFRYVVLYNSTSGKLIGWYDRGSSLSMLSGDSFTTDFNGTTGVLTIGP